MGSTMLRRVLKFVGWSVAVLAACGALFYVVLIGINWRDQPPSETALAFEKAYRERPAVPHEQNGYVFMLGIGVAPTEDVRAMGSERFEWMQKPLRAAGKDPLSSPYDYASVRPEAVREFVKSCARVGPPCEDGAAKAAAIYREWSASEPWLLERYEQLLGHSGWLEVVIQDAAAPLPDYRLVMDGQRFWFAKAATAATAGNSEEVRALLARDLRFWRAVFAESDMLITKMIAVAALTRHFEFGNLILRSLPQGSAAPEDWSQALSNAELSMQRVLAGEWIFWSTSLRNSLTGEEADEDSSLITAWTFSKPLFQPQDTTNELAKRYEQLIRVLDVPIERWKSANAHAKQWAGELASRPESFHFYNPAGKRLLAAGINDFSDYTSRVSDIEGVRRAALLATRLRASGVSMQDASTAVSASDLRNPYDHLPFEWDTDGGFIVFKGLAPGERGVHRIRY